MVDHAQGLSSWFGEHRGIRMFRRHATWYTKGFPRSATLRRALTAIETLDDLGRALSGIDPDVPFPPSALRVPRGKTSGTQCVSLPDGWLDDLEDPTPPGSEAELIPAGG
jgi:hypothetical protein